MNQSHHPLIHDFPELRERIHTLKTTSAHFAKLEREYEDLDKAIVRLENGLEHASSGQLQQLQQRRVTLKDELYAMLKA